MSPFAAANRRAGDCAPCPDATHRRHVFHRNDLTRRGFLALLGVAGIALMLLGGGCANTAGQRAAPSPTPPPRAWDDSEIIRAGRWAG